MYDVLFNMADFPSLADYDHKAAMLVWPGQKASVVVPSEAITHAGEAYLALNPWILGNTCPDRVSIVPPLNIIKQDL